MEMSSYCFSTWRGLVCTYAFKRIKFPLKNGILGLKALSFFSNGYYIRWKVYVYTKRRMLDEALYMASIIFQFELLTRNIRWVMSILVISGIDQ